MRKLFAAVLLLTAAAAHAGPKADVLAAVDATLAAINTNDPALFGRVMLPDAIIVAQNYQAGDDRLTTSTRTVAEMADRLRAAARRIDERRTDTKVFIQRDLAHVWAAYTLDVDGKRLHCGIDSFGLVKVGGQWRVASLAWTAEPAGCPK